MSTIDYTHQGLILFLKELKIQLNKPARALLAWLMVALLEKTRALKPGQYRFLRHQTVTQNSEFVMTKN